MTADVLTFDARLNIISSTLLSLIDFAIFVQHVEKRMPDQMNDAELDLRLRIDRLNRFRETFQDIHAGNENVHVRSTDRVIQIKIGEYYYDTR